MRNVKCNKSEDFDSWAQLMPCRRERPTEKRKKKCIQFLLCVLHSSPTGCVVVHEVVVEFVSRHSRAILYRWRKKIVELVRKEEKTSTEMKWSTKNSTQSDAVLLSLFFSPLYTLFFRRCSGCKSISARRWYHKLAAKVFCGIFTELKTQPLEWAHGIPIEIEALW